MCGIAGIISSRNDATPADVLRMMTRSIEHRGPDDEGFFETRTPGDHYVGLGHRRLSIIDLSTGHQPIANEIDSIHIVFNGEIYNFQELREELEEKGHEFKTHSDTETIIHAYEEFGVECVHKLRGMFAFAIWDAENHQLFLARDRYGQKPLFIAEQDDVLLFASEIKAIVHWPWLEAGTNTPSIPDYLCYRYVPGPRTLFQGIRKLEAGCYATWQNDALVERRYYTPPDRNRRIAGADQTRCRDQFLTLLDEAVRIRMISDVPFGAFLSGGIDSSVVVALMSRHSNIPVKTFSVGFTESQYSELQYARTIADQFKTEHHELRISSDDLIKELPELIRFRDAPVAEPSDIPIYLLAKEARKKVKMVLTGEGADEFLGGYRKHVFERYVAAFQAVPAGIRRHVVAPAIRALPYAFRGVKTGLANMNIGAWPERMPRWFGALTREECARFLQDPSQVNLIHQQMMPDADNNSDLRKILFFDQVSWLPDNLLERGDRMTMAASLEARMPFMDHILAEYVSSLPDKFRVRGKTTKWILREVAKELIPPAIINRPKVGFRVPVNEWFQDTMRDYLHDHICTADSRIREYLVGTEIDRVFHEHTNGKHNHEKLLWALLNLEIWHRLNENTHG